MRIALALSTTIVLFVSAGCTRQAAKPKATAPASTPAAIVEVSGGKQISTIGTSLDQPVVVQVNDAQGAAVAGAPVSFRSANGVVFQPASGVTGSDGQFTFGVALGDMAGRYQLVASTTGAAGKQVEVRIEEIALGLEQNRGREVSNRYCVRCHDSESTPERVSNFDNLTAKPHLFGDGAFLNRMSDTELLAIISHGGPALGRSAEMPPYDHTLSRADIDSLISYIRAISDPPYRTKELVYAQK